MSHVWACPNRRDDTVSTVTTWDLYLRLSDLRTEDLLRGREKALRAEVARLGGIVGRVVIENDVARRTDGKTRPASAFKRRAVRNSSGEVIRDPDTGKPVMRVIRPGWQTIIADLKTGRASGVLAEDLDRACRDPRDLEDLLDACAQHGASARSLTGSLTLTNGGNDAEHFMARVMVAQAHKSSTDTARRVRGGHARWHGVSYPGGLRPFGFAHALDTEEHQRTLIVVPDEARLLATAAADILDRDISLHAITRDWRARGILTVTGKQWTAQTLRDALLKPAIAGLAVLHGDIKPAPWAHILERDVWERLRAKLEDPGRRVMTGNEPKHFASLIAQCGICGDGSTVTVTGSSAGKARGPRAGGPSYVCPNGGYHLRRNQRHVDSAIERVVIEWLEEYGKTALKPPPRSAGVNAPGLRAEARRLRKAEGEQLALHREGVITTGALKSSLRDFRDRLEVIEAQLSVSDQPDPLAEFRVAPARVAWAGLTMPRKRAILRMLFTVTMTRTSHRGPYPLDRDAAARSLGLEFTQHYPGGKPAEVA